MTVKKFGMSVFTRNLDLSSCLASNVILTVVFRLYKSKNGTGKKLVENFRENRKNNCFMFIPVKKVE